MSRRPHRRIAVVLACVLVMTGALACLSQATATRATYRFTAVADAYVSQARPYRNFAGTPALRTDAFPRSERSYLRFAVARLAGAVTRARLRMYAETTSRTGFAVRWSVVGAWTEDKLTFSTAPKPGPVVARSGPVARDGWTTVDVTPLVHGAGMVDLVLTTDDRSAALYASRETGVTAPQLVVETVEGAIPGQTTATTNPPSTTRTTTSSTTSTTSSTTSTTRPSTTSTNIAPAPSGTLAYGTPERPFSTTSAWNRPIPANAALASNSAGMVRHLSSGGHYNVTNGAQGQYGAPVFYADASTPRYTWGSHCGPISGKQVPIPPGSHEAQGPGASPDHKYIVIDTSTKLVYDIWGADVEGRDCLKWGYQGYGIITSLTTANDGAPGINGEKAPTGASTSSLAGLLRAHDATHLDADGTYGHALQGSSKYGAKGRWVSPATSSDGPDTSPDAIPQGSRLQLNPSFNCGAISVPGVRAYCRTAQKYGIILMDTSPVHALTIYQEDIKDNPAIGNPFDGGYWGTDADWPSLASVPLNQFRVVAPF